MEAITKYQENSKKCTVKISGILIRFLHATGSISKFHGASSKEKQKSTRKWPKAQTQQTGTHPTRIRIKPDASEALDGSGLTQT